MSLEPPHWMNAMDLHFLAVGGAGDAALLLDHFLQIDVANHVFKLAVGQSVSGILRSPAGCLDDGPDAECVQDFAVRFAVAG